MNNQLVEIWLMEDDPADRELALHMPRSNQLANAIETVSDGAAALDSVRGRGALAHRGNVPRPRLILLDLKLPKVDGIGS